MSEQYQFCSTFATWGRGTTVGLSCRPVSLQPYQSLSNHSIQEIRKRFIKSVTCQCRVFPHSLSRSFGRTEPFPKSHTFFSRMLYFYVSLSLFFCAKMSIL